MEELVKNLEDEEKNDEENVMKNELEESKTSFKESKNSKKSNLNQSKSIASRNAFLVYGRTFTLDEVKEHAKKSYTDEQIAVIKEREEFSKSLFDKLNSPECRVIIK